MLTDLESRATELQDTVEAAQAYGAEAVAVSADVRDLEALQAAAASMRARFGRVDALVANAGIAPPPAAAWEIPEAEWQRVLDVNLTGVQNTCTAAIPHMIESGQQPAMVLISSTAGIDPMPMAAHYSAAKAGVRSLAGTLANELGRHGIRVNSLHPAAVDTPMTDEVAAHVGIDRSAVLANFTRLQLLDGVVSADDVSAAVVWLLSQESRFVTGQALCVDAGFTARTIPFAFD
jgi:NAD(P)-dependent dehydrogenase (short-subunit alcohol dehydrogenase family)